MTRPLPLGVVLMLTVGVQAVTQKCAGPPAMAPDPAAYATVLVLRPDNPTLVVGQMLQFTARIERPTGEIVDANPPIVWTSSNEAVGPISPNGLVTGRQNGVTVIQAASQVAPYMSKTTTLTVVPFTSDWKYLGAVLADGRTETDLCDIAVDPRDDRVLYVSTRSGLYISRNMGGTWTSAVSHGSTLCGPVVIDPFQPDRIWYATESDVPIFRLDDGGRTWTPLENPAPTIMDLVVSRYEPGAVFVSAGWQAAGEPSVFVSKDDGDSWTPLSFGNARPDLATDRYIIPWSLAEDPVDGTLYTSIEVGDHPKPYQPPFMRSTDRGATWRDVAGWDRGGSHLTTVWWHAQKTVVETTTGAVLVGTEGPGIYRSTDRGDTWRLWQNSNPPAVTHGIMEDAAHPGRFFAVSRPDDDNSWPGGVYVSVDGAVTFSPFGMTGRMCSYHPAAEAERWALGLALNATGTRLFASCRDRGVYVTAVPGGTAQGGRRIQGP